MESTTTFEVLPLDPTVRMYEGIWERRVSITQQEAEFLIAIAPDTATKQLIAHRFATNRREPATNAAGFTLFTMWLPETTYLVPTARGRNAACTLPDALYWLHQSARLMTTFAIPGDVLQLDDTWFRQKLGLKAAPVEPEVATEPDEAYVPF